VWPYALLVFAILLAVYVRTLMPGLVGGDAGELQYAGPLFTLVHPTGQPLYVTLGYLWSRLVPIGDMAYRMNLLAAVSGAATGALLTYLFARVYHNRLIAAAAGLALGFGATFWRQAVLADKYAFTALLTAPVIGLALWWASTRAGPRGDRLLYALSLAFGVTLLHHRSLLLLAPPLALLVLAHERAALWRNGRRTMLCLALVFLPALIVYPTLLPIMRARNLSVLDWQPSTLREWSIWMQERHYIVEGALVFDNLSAISARLAIYWQTLVRDYTLAIPIVALLGLAIMARQQPANALFLLLSYLLLAFFSANYRANERQFTYYLPSFVVLLYAYGYGLLAMWTLARRTIFSHTPVSPSISRVQGGLGIARTSGGRSFETLSAISRSRLALPLLGTAFIFILPMLQFARGYPERRMEALYGAPLDFWRQTLKSGDMGERAIWGMELLPPNTILASDWEQATILWYKQRIDGVRPDLEFITPIDRYANHVDDERPVCVTRHIAPQTLPPGLHLTNVGALACLRRAPSTEVPPGVTPIGTVFLSPEGTPQLELVGYQGNLGAHPPGQHVPLLLTWRASADLDTDYRVSMQILDENWNKVWSRDGFSPGGDFPELAAPVLGMYPTSNWSGGEVVQDYRELSIPPALSPGRYLWVVVVYNQKIDGTSYELRDPQGNVAILGGTFEVVPPR
jgi:hypothetical protein